MTDSTWHQVGLAILGSWPSQVASWGEDAIEAYLGELGARGLTPAMALEALRACPATQKFPPSAPELAGLARHDPDRPTPDECLQQLYGPGGIFGFKRKGFQVNPWVEAFASNYGRDRLRLLEVDDPQYGELVRKDLRASYERFLEASEGREVAAIAAGRRGSLGKFDPVAALDRETPCS